MENFLWNRGTYSMAINRTKHFKRAGLIAVALVASAMFTPRLKAGEEPDAKNADKQHTLPVTSASAAARRYFENGMVQYENHRWNFALEDWHQAVKLDPDFAQAHVWIAMTTVDPAEESKHRELAKASMEHATPAEQLLVRWMAGIHENNYVAGIAAMNDLLAQYPQDKRLNFLCGYWLYKLDQYDLAEKLTQRALVEDPRYATAYNQMGYIYSRRGDYQKAIEAESKYVELLPNEPNPHDSYGEMLRLSGRFEDALEQYHIALKIDPTFYISQKELGETYAIMGDGEKAREEYAKAIHEAPSDGLKAEYLQKAAMTYVRGRQYDEADKAYLDAAAKAHQMQQWVWEARAYRIMAMYETDAKAASANLEKAESILAEKKGSVAQSDLDEEQAHIWRVRVERAAAAHEFTLAGNALEKLDKMAQTGGSVSIERTHDGAVGTLLVAEKKFAAAIPQLEDDFANPLSMKQLLLAYQKDKHSRSQAGKLEGKLRAWRIPSIEEALVVPQMKEAGTEVSKK